MRRAIPTLVVLFFLFAAACSQPKGDSASEDGSEGSLRDTILASAEKTEEAGSARILQKVSSKGAPGGQDINMIGRGMVDFEEQEGQMTMRMSSVLGQGSTTMQTLFEGFTVYFKSPIFSRSLPTAKPWVKLDLEAAARQQGMDLGALSGLGQRDPTETLEYLKGASQDVTELGGEEVRGVETTHYRAIVDLEEVGEHVSGPTGQSIARLQQMLGSKTMPVEVWLDDEGLVRRQRFTTPIPQASGGRDVELTTEMDLYDYGVEVDVSPPPRSRTTDLLELLKRP